MSESLLFVLSQPPYIYILHKYYTNVKCLGNFFFNLDITFAKTEFQNLKTKYQRMKVFIFDDVLALLYKTDIKRHNVTF